RAGFQNIFDASQPNRLLLSPFLRQELVVLAQAPSFQKAEEIVRSRVDVMLLDKASGNTSEKDLFMRTLQVLSEMKSDIAGPVPDQKFASFTRRDLAEVEQVLKSELSVPTPPEDSDTQNSLKNVLVSLGKILTITGSSLAENIPARELDFLPPEIINRPAPSHSQPTNVQGASQAQPSNQPFHYSEQSVVSSSSGLTIFNESQPAAQRPSRGNEILGQSVSLPADPLESLSLLPSPAALRELQRFLESAKPFALKQFFEKLDLSGFTPHKVRVLQNLNSVLTRVFSPAPAEHASGLEASAPVMPLHEAIETLVFLKAHSMPPTSQSAQTARFLLFEKPSLSRELQGLHVELTALQDRDGISETVKKQAATLSSLIEDLAIRPDDSNVPAKLERYVDKGGLQLESKLKAVTEGRQSPVDASRNDLKAEASRLKSMLDSSAISEEPQGGPSIRAVLNRVDT